MRKWPSILNALMVCALVLVVCNELVVVYFTVLRWMEANFGLHERANRFGTHSKIRILPKYTIFVSINIKFWNMFTYSNDYREYADWAKNKSIQPVDCLDIQLFKVNFWRMLFTNFIHSKSTSSMHKLPNIFNKYHWRQWNCTANKFVLIV